MMLLLAQILTALILLLHIYIVLLETVLFDTRGRKVFGLPREKAEIVRPAMSNQGCYNGFLVAALALGPITHIRLNVFPDGGVSRLRVLGKVAK